MKSIRNTALGLTMGLAAATTAMADDLTIAIVNNGHMINMQKVAEAYTAETGTKSELGIFGRRRFARASYF